MPSIMRGTNYFAALYFSCLGFTALLAQLQAGGTRDCNYGSKFKKRAMKCCKENKITAPTLMCGIFLFRREI